MSASKGKAGPEPSYRGRKVMLSLAAVAVLAGGAYAVSHYVKAAKNTPPREFSVAALEAKAQQDPGKLFEQMHGLRERTDLNDQQKEAIHDNVRTVMEAQFDKRIDEYLNASPAEKTAILDRQLDEMQTRMREWQQRRAQHNAQQGGQPGNQGRGGGPNATPNSGHQPGNGVANSSQHGGRQGGPRQWTREQRKEHSEARSPDRSAKRMAYFSALQSRAKERGIQMPFGGRGGGPHGG